LDADLTGNEGGAMQAEETQSLYERLGGVYAIAVVVGATTSSTGSWATRG
jgi:hypothetical protein